MAEDLWNIAGPLPDSDELEQAAFRHAVGRIYTHVDDTESLVPAVVALLERVDRRHHADLWVYIQRCLATRSTILADYSAAEPRIAAALAVVKLDDTPLEYFNLLNLRGLICKFKGDYARAIETHCAVLRTVRSRGLFSHGMVAVTNLAYVLMEMGSPTSAHNILTQCSDLLEATSPRGTEQYWTARLACADTMQDRAGAREAIHALTRIQAINHTKGIPNDPSAVAAVRTLGPLNRMSDTPTEAELTQTGTLLLREVLRETRFMPGYRLKAAVDCAWIALQLDQGHLALQLVELGRAIRPENLPVHWATQLEELAARVYEARGDYKSALDAERRARKLERTQHMTGLQSGTKALIERATEDVERLRAVELEQVNDALRITTRRMDAALYTASRERSRAEDAAGARHRFLSRMSHELRTPLQGVLGAIELLHETELDNTQQELTEMLDRSAQLTLGIINDILDVGRLEEGRIQLEQRPFPLRSVVEDAISQVHMRACEQNLQLQTYFDPTLPRMVLGDRRRLTQIMLNLLSNAVKYTSQGSIHVSVKPSNDAIVFTVKDTGCGIAAADLAHIFDPYTRAQHSHNNDTEGSGLGLAIVHGLIKAMQGTIKASSKPGVGTTFHARIRLPAVQSSHLPTPSRATPALTPTLSGVRVLLAEDNSVSQVVLQRHIRMLGGQVEVVDSGPKALKRARETPFDVLILDFHMPGLSGLEVSRRLRRAGYNLPIIGLTASALPEDEAAARAAHMDAYATKPISRVQLQQLVHGTVESRRA